MDLWILWIARVEFHDDYDQMRRLAGIPYVASAATPVVIIGGK